MADTVARNAINLAWFVTGRRPIYSNGREIGYSRNLEEVCQGIVNVYDPGEKSDPRTWYTKDNLFRDIKVTDYCLQTGRVPKWVSAQEVAKLPQKPTGGFIVNQTIDPKLLIVGGVALAAILLLGNRR